MKLMALRIVLTAIMGLRVLANWVVVATSEGEEGSLLPIPEILAIVTAWVLQYTHIHI